MQLETSAAPAGAHPPVSAGRSAPAVDAAAGDAPSLASRALAVMKRDPVLFVTLGYVAISFIGLWASWWFYRMLGLPILDYLQASDFLVAGLREPAYAFAFAVTLGMAWLLAWPERVRRSDPERAARLAGAWCGRLLFPRGGGPRTLMGMRHDTALVATVVGGMLAIVAGMSIGAAQAVRDGRGDPVRVIPTEGSRALPGDIRLLGTSATFAFLYWPGERRIEAMTLESIARIRTLPRRVPAAAAPQWRPAPAPAPAPASRPTAPAGPVH